MNKAIHLISLIALFAGATTVFAGDVTPQRILCYGDSITAIGTWVKTVGNDDAFVTINAGRSGRRASQATKELKPYLKKYSDLDAIIIFLGVNDLPARDKRPGDVKVAGCVADISEAIDLAMTRFEAKDIILVAPCDVNPDTMDGRNRQKGYHVTSPLLAELEKEYKTLAEKKGIRFLSLLNVVSEENFKDGLHPNKAGDAEIAEAILSYLRKHYAPLDRP
jgi:lysophospholipase L1-like esterase